MNHFAGFRVAFKLLLFWRLRLGLTMNWPTMRFWFLFCFVFVCLFVCLFFLSETEPRAPVNVFDWMDILQSSSLWISIRRPFEKNYRVLAGIPSSLSSLARIPPTLPLLRVTPATQAMTFPVKRVSSATLKLNTDQNLMSSICESNIVINKSQLVSMLLRPCSLLGSTVMVPTKTALGWHFSNRFDETRLWLGHWFPEFLDFCWLSTWWNAQSLLRFFCNSWCKTRCFSLINNHTMN